MAKAAEFGYARLPQGRFLYRAGSASRYLVLCRRDKEYWLAPDGWTIGCEAAGPFRAEDVLRALSFASVTVPEGCEKGPWQEGVNLLSRAALPGVESEWGSVEPAWLPWSVTQYAGDGAEHFRNETCCSPSAAAPRITWIASPHEDVYRSARMDRSRLPVAGTLEREWNMHAAGSLVLAENDALIGEFVVVDTSPE
jgi:hypothetical protein